MNAIGREWDGSTVTLTCPSGRLVATLADAGTLVVLDRSSVPADAAEALGRALGEEAPPGVQLLVWDATPGDPKDRAARAGGWRPAARKVFVERDLADLTTTPDPAVSGWALASYAELGPDVFADRMVRAALGDPFETSTPESALDDLLELVDAAGDAFDPTRWVVVRDADGDIGVILPQRYADTPTDGTLFYIGVMPERRGRGHGTRLHLLGLQMLASAGVRRYVGSTDERNTAMIRAMATNGAVVTRTQCFYRARSRPAPPPGL